MPTVKLVAIGSSGVGKTSLRNQYVSGRFSTGYRATIGADFITKTLPHPTNPSSAEGVTLQIWDTAGQERFSSLSSAFFRGADAVLLMFDVNDAETMEELRKWWDQFKEKRPVREEDVKDFCVVFVGNKVDLTGDEGVKGKKRVEEQEAKKFMSELIPEQEVEERLEEDQPESIRIHEPLSANGVPWPSSPIRARTDSIDITTASVHHRSPSHSPPTPLHHHLLSTSHRRRSRSTGSSRGLHGGTISTMNTTHTIFHTPSSSFFDVYESARSSPMPHSPSPSSRSRLSRSTASSNSGVTITPSLFARGDQTTSTSSPPTPTIPKQEPDTHPRLFWTSAKTGVGVNDVFEYVANRVVGRWELEEEAEELVAETVTLGSGKGKGRRVKWGEVCCGS